MKYIYVVKEELLNSEGGIADAHIAAFTDRESAKWCLKHSAEVGNMSLNKSWTVATTKKEGKIVHKLEIIKTPLIEGP